MIGKYCYTSGWRPACGIATLLFWGLLFSGCRQGRVPDTQPKGDSIAPSHQSPAMYLSAQQKEIIFSLPTTPNEAISALGVTLDSVFNPDMKEIALEAHLLDDRGGEHPLGKFSTFPANQGGKFTLSLRQLMQRIPTDDLRAMRLRLRLVSSVNAATKIYVSPPAWIE